MSSLSEKMQADALEAQRFSRKHLVLELDFSAASIREIEAQVDSIAYALRGGLSAENVDMLSRIWGAYLGEALRRARGGEWERTDDGRVGLKGAWGTAFPHQQVRQRLTDGEAYNLDRYFASMVEQMK